MRPGLPHGNDREAPTVSVVAEDLAAARRFCGEGPRPPIGTDTETADLDGPHAQRRRIGTNILAAPQQVDAERVMLVRGPNEELFEFAERR
jgi:hypothetical protein